MCGCDATSEFKIATKEAPEEIIYYAIEKSSFCIRLVCEFNTAFETVAFGTVAFAKKIA